LSFNNYYILLPESFYFYTSLVPPMTTIKEKLIASIENAPEPILEKTLDYLEYLKTKITASTIKSSSIPIKDGEPILRGCKAKDLL